ncbi:MAG: hypothetical protein H0U57_00285 [Tatlockia sp.]|nr:hypothetical protein [Tatlockia sp.]
MSKSKYEKVIDNGLELAQNTSAGVFYGGFSNLVANNFSNKPLRVYPGALMGGLLFFGLTRIGQCMNLGNAFDEVGNTDSIPKNK